MTTETNPTRNYRVKNVNETPPGGWSWKRWDGDTLRSAGGFQPFVTKVEALLIESGRDFYPAEDEIHEHTGKRLYHSGHANLVTVTDAVQRTAEHYASGAKAAFLKWWKESPIIGMLNGKVDRGEPVFVDQSEANRRATICAGCPENVIPSSKTWLQNWSDGKMLNSVEGRKTSRNDDLGVCKVCSCELRAATWWTPDVLLASMKGKSFVEKFPDFCWKKKLTKP